MPRVMPMPMNRLLSFGHKLTGMALTLLLAGSLSAGEITSPPRVRIQAIASRPVRAAVRDSQVKPAAALAPPKLDSLFDVARLNKRQEEAAPALEPAQPMPAGVQITPVPNSSAQETLPPQAPIPSVLEARGKLTSQSEAFYKKLTPTDRELLYDGRLPDEYGIGRTFDFVVDGEKIDPPENVAAKIFSQEPIEISDYGFHHDWAPMLAAWEAPAFYHRPLYFEEVNLERYGHKHRYLQPVYSAAHFFGNALALPYKMGVNPPCERIYTLGHYRPGDCNPHDRHGLPFSWRGVIYTGAFYSGIGAAFP